jgi:hypothetical protein
MSRYDGSTRVIYDHGPMGWVLFTAYIGAAIYFVNHAVGFWQVILALLKAAVWPAYVLYELMTRLAV